jgi:transposase
MSELGNITQATLRMRRSRPIEPYMPAIKRLGRPRETDLRVVVDTILYIARRGCQWRLLPKDFPPFANLP